jgi:hypothetical protein
MGTVLTVKIHNSEVTACTPKCVRDDNDVLTESEKKISMFVQGLRYIIPNYSSLIPSIILEGQTYAITSGLGLGGGLLLGAGVGFLKKKSSPSSSYEKDWYYWSITWAIYRPLAKILYVISDLFITALTVLFTIWKPHYSTIGNGLVHGGKVGYNFGRVGADMIYDKYINPCSPQQQEMQNILNNDANDDDDLELN